MSILFLFRLVRVEEHQRLIISRGGRYYDIGVQGGRAFLLRFLDTPIVLDMRPHPVEVRNIRCYTRDNCSTTVNGCFLWQIVHPLHFLLGPTNLQNILEIKMISALQSTISGMDLEQVLQGREQLNHTMTEALRVPREWGVRVRSAEVRDAWLPLEIEAARNREVAAERNRQAARIEAVGAAEAFRAFESALGREAALEMYKLGVLSNGSWFWSPLEVLEKNDRADRPGKRVAG